MRLAGREPKGRVSGPGRQFYFVCRVEKGIRTELQERLAKTKCLERHEREYIAGARLCRGRRWIAYDCLKGW